MNPNRFKKYLPTKSWVEDQRYLGPLRRLLLEPELWHLHRRSVDGAFFIGLFCAWLPIPFQTVVAAVAAMLTRRNLPVSVALVFVTNPFTMGPMFYFAYKLGAWLLNVEVATDQFEWSWMWFTEQLTAIWWPFLLGCLICGWVSGLTGLVFARMMWNLHIIRRWRARRKRRAEAHGSKPQ